MNPKITIGIPTVDRLYYLKECYNSVCAQSYKNIEIIIGIDLAPGAKCASPEIMDFAGYIQRKDSRVKVLISDRNLGLAGNWNRLVANSTGQYMMIIGDDDRLLPNTLFGFVNHIEARCDVYFSNHYVIDSEGVRIVDQDFNRKYHRSEIEEGIVTQPQTFIWLNAISISSALISVNLLKQIGFNEDLNTPELPFFLKADLSGASFYFVSENLVEYRIHASSATTNGLRTEKLYFELLKIPAEDHAKSERTGMLEKLAFPAVTRCLVKGDRRSAVMIMRSKYYTVKRGGTLKLFFHCCGLGLPTSIFIPLLKFFRSVCW